MVPEVGTEVEISTNGCTFTIFSKFGLGFQFVYYLNIIIVLQIIVLPCWILFQYNNHKNYARSAAKMWILMTEALHRHLYTYLS